MNISNIPENFLVWQLFNYIIDNSYYIVHLSKVLKTVLTAKMQFQVWIYLLFCQKMILITISPLCVKTFCSLLCLHSMPYNWKHWYMNTEPCTIFCIICKFKIISGKIQNMTYVLSLFISLLCFTIFCVDSLLTYRVGRVTKHFVLCVMSAMLWKTRSIIKLACDQETL